MAGLLLLGGMTFSAYALGHPEGSFRWGNGVTYTVYAAYFIVTLGVVGMAIRSRRNNQDD